MNKATSAEGSRIYVEYAGKQAIVVLPVKKLLPREEENEVIPLLLHKLPLSTEALEYEY
jgi:hypothetical protein